MHIKPSEEGCRALLGFYSSHLAYARITGEAMTDAKRMIALRWRRRRVVYMTVHDCQMELDTLVDEGVLTLEG
jgi:hypothetical protein